MHKGALWTSASDEVQEGLNSDVTLKTFPENQTIAPSLKVFHYVVCVKQRKEAEVCMCDVFIYCGELPCK